MATTDAVDMLRSIDATLKAILLVLSEKRNAAPARPDVDLDGPHGNPTVKAKDPRDWTGDSMIGRTFSECPAEYLDLLADRLEYFASKEEDPKKKRYNELDAARARGWAERVRNGKVAPPPQTGGEPRW